MVSLRKTAATSTLALAATFCAAALLPTGAFASGSSMISGLDAMRTWNLVVLGDLTSSSEVEGRTWVSGNLDGNSSNYQISGSVEPSTGTPGLTVVGNVTGGAKNLNNASGAVVGGNVSSGFNLNGGTQTVLVGGSISNTNVNDNTVTSGLAASDPAFSQNLGQQASLLETSMEGLAHTLSGLDANSTANFSGNRGTFNAQPGSDGVAVFSISSADLDSIGEIAFNPNGADTVVVNVSGANIRLDDNFLGGTNGLGENVIWNFFEAETLDLSTAWGGSVLAPNADARTRNYIEGSGVFGSLVQDGEMHVGTYNGTYDPPRGGDTPPSSSSGGSSSGGTPVPEPGTAGLLGLGALGLAFALRRRRART